MSAVGGPRGRGPALGPGVLHARRAYRPSAGHADPAPDPDGGAAAYPPRDARPDHPDRPRPDARGGRGRRAPWGPGHPGPGGATADGAEPRRHRGHRRARRDRLRGDDRLRRPGHEAHLPRGRRSSSGEPPRQPCGRRGAAPRLVPRGGPAPRAGPQPRRLEAKEGLALLNGTQMMTAVGALAVLDAERLARTASVVAAMSTEALLGTDVAFSAAYHATRPPPRQARAAAELRHLLRDSELP